MVLSLRAGRDHGGPTADHVEHRHGSEIMQRIAVPMIGGMISSTLLTLVVIPAIYGLIKGYQVQEPRLAPTSLPTFAVQQ
jgi:hypothetical protein